MSKKVQKTTGKGSEVNGECSDVKGDGTSVLVSDLQGFTLADPISMIAGLAAGYREQQRKK